MQIVEDLHIKRAAPGRSVCMTGTTFRPWSTQPQPAAVHAWSATQKSVSRALADSARLNSRVGWAHWRPMVGADPMPTPASGRHHPDRAAGPCGAPSWCGGGGSDACAPGGAEPPRPSGGGWGGWAPPGEESRIRPSTGEWGDPVGPPGSCGVTGSRGAAPLVRVVVNGR
jgi:hypothetical protein